MVYRGIHLFIYETLHVVFMRALILFLMNILFVVAVFFLNPTFEFFFIAFAYLTLSAVIIAIPMAQGRRCRRKD